MQQQDDATTTTTKSLLQTEFNGTLATAASLKSRSRSRGEGGARGELRPEEEEEEEESSDPNRDPPTSSESTVVALLSIWRVGGHGSWVAGLAWSPMELVEGEGGPWSSQRGREGGREGVLAGAMRWHTAFPCEHAACCNRIERAT